MGKGVYLIVYVWKGKGGGRTVQKIDVTGALAYILSTHWPYEVKKKKKKKNLDLMKDVQQTF
jgi:hypothetical protein